MGLLVDPLANTFAVMVLGGWSPLHPSSRICTKLCQLLEQVAWLLVNGCRSTRAESRSGFHMSLCLGRDLLLYV
jgi:hypothetical protein